MYKLSLLNILRSKVKKKKKNTDEFPGRKEMYFLINSILRTRFPLFENEFLEIPLRMTQLSFYFQKGIFNQGREFKNIWTGAVFQGQKENKDYIFLLYNHLPHTCRRGFISSL